MQGQHIYQYGQQTDLKANEDFFFAHPNSTGGFSISALKVSGEKSDWFYTWAMPASLDHSPSSAGFHTEISMYTRDMGTYKVFARGGRIGSVGQVVRLKLRPLRCAGFPDDKLPLDYVSDYNLSKDSQGQWRIQEIAWKQNQNPLSYGNQLFRHRDVEHFSLSAPVGGRMINGKKYFLPDAKDWSAVFPYLFDRDGKSTPRIFDIPLTGAATQTMVVPFDKLRIGGADKYSFEAGRSIFMRMPDGNIYALRFLREENCRALAYRYQFVGQGVLTPSGSHYLKISSRRVIRPWGSLGDSEGGDWAKMDMLAKEFLETYVVTQRFWDRAQNPGVQFSKDVLLPTKGIKKGGTTYSKIFMGVRTTYSDGDTGFYAGESTGLYDRNAFGWIHEPGPQRRVSLRRAASIPRYDEVELSVRLFEQMDPVP